MQQLSVCQESVTVQWGGAFVVDQHLMLKTLHAIKQPRKYLKSSNSQNSLPGWMMINKDIWTKPSSLSHCNKCYEFDWNILLFWDQVKQRSPALFQETSKPKSPSFKKSLNVAITGNCCQIALNITASIFHVACQFNLARNSLLSSLGIVCNGFKRQCTFLLLLSYIPNHFVWFQNVLVFLPTRPIMYFFLIQAKNDC